MFEFIECFSILLSLILVIVVAFYFYGKSNYGYWKKRNVPCPDNQTPFFGDFTDVLFATKPMSKIMTETYKLFASERFVGGYQFTEPVLTVHDPALIESILVKDFSYFNDRVPEGETLFDVMDNNLFNLTGSAWRILRNKLSPTFTSGKLKEMISQIEECVDMVVRKLEEVPDNEPVELYGLANDFAEDVIASCAFGLKTSIVNGEKSPFGSYGRDLFRPNRVTRVIFLAGPRLSLVRKMMAWMGEKFLGGKFKRLVRESVEYRKKHNVVRKDFLHLITELKDEDSRLIAEGKLDPKAPGVINELSLVSNALVFFIAGFDSTTAILSLALYELAVNQEVQEKLYREIKEVLQNHCENITYEVLKKMDYLRQVLDETLRLYPPTFALVRVATKEYKIPDSDVVLDRGTQVFVPVYAIQRDPRYYPEPNKFNPERFTPENLASIRKFTYLPFGDGPRMCIASRFALMEIKLAMIHTLRNFKVKTCEKTDIPFVEDKTALAIVPKNGIWLSFEKRDSKTGVSK